MIKRLATNGGGTVAKYNGCIVLLNETCHTPNKFICFAFLYLIDEQVAINWLMHERIHHAEWKDDNYSSSNGFTPLLVETNSFENINRSFDQYTTIEPRIKIHEQFNKEFDR